MKSKSAFYFIVIAVHAFVFWYACMYGNIYTKDSNEYLSQAHNLKEYGSWYCGNLNEQPVPELYSQRPPMYGIIILLIQFISESNFLLLFAQCILSIITIYILFAISRLLKIQTNLIFVLISLLFFPSQFIYANMVMSEVLLQFFVILSIYLFLFYIQGGQYKHMLCFQLCVAAALLTKPIFIAYPVLSLLIIFFIPEFKKRKLVIYSHIIPVLAIVLVSLSNYNHTGYFEYSSIARKLSVNYNALYSASFNNGNEAALAEIDSLQQTAALQKNYSEKAQILQSGAGRIIGKNLDAYVLLSVKGLFVFFTDHSRYDIDQFTSNKYDSGLKNSYLNNGWNGVIRWINDLHPAYFVYLCLAMFFNFILLLGLIRFCFIAEVPLPIRLLIAGTIFYVALLTGMTGTTRFRLPVFPLILIANLLALQNFRFPYLKKRMAQEQE